MPEKISIERKAEPRQVGSSDATTESVVELLTSILDQVQKQVRSKTPDPLEGLALQAADRFKEIVAALDLRPRPTFDLTNDPAQGGSVTLRWVSTNTRTISLKQKVGEQETDLGELTPVADGSKTFSGNGLTTFTATAKGACASAVDSVVVNLSN